MNGTRIPIEFREPAPRLQVALRQAAPAGSRPPAAVVMNLNRESGNFTKVTNSNRQLVEALAGSAIFREYQTAFEETTGLPLALRAVEGWQLAHHGNRRQNGFCAM